MDVNNCTECKYCDLDQVNYSKWFDGVVRFGCTNKKRAEETTP